MFGIRALLRSERLFFILFFVGIYLILFANSLHERYPDEFDNIIGGYLINHGVFPYTGFFSHHGPVSYFLAGILTPISSQSFVFFRFLTTFFYLFLLIFTFFIFKKRIKTLNVNFLLLYILVFALSAAYFWGHMFLADPISGYFLVISYGLLFLKIYKKEGLEFADLIIISVFSFLAVLNSITYIYAVFILVSAAFLYYLLFIYKSGKKILLKSFGLLLILFLSPYLLFLLYLIVTQSLDDYFFQAIIYNKNHYIYNYPRPPGSTNINPIRYAVVIFNNFFNAYQPLLVGIRDFYFPTPFNVTLALSNAFLWIFLAVKRRYLLLLLSFLTILFVNVRSNPIASKATDYQSSVYFMLTFLHAAFLFSIVKKEIELFKSKIIRLAVIVLFLLFSVYWFYNILYIFGNIFRMTYLRYMGEMPLIYDRPQVANIINEVVPKDRYCWVGPFSFEEILYLDCKLPSRYHWILPQFAGIERIKKEILEDYRRNKPDVIVYNRRFETFGSTAEFGRFFLNFLDANYVRLKDINPAFHFKESKTLDFKRDDDFNFEKSEARELVNLLVQKGYVEE